MAPLAAVLRSDHTARSPRLAGVSFGQRERASALEPEGMVPGISPVALRLFAWYGRRFVRRHFHAVRLNGTAHVPADLPLVVYCNHASWWDPLILMQLTRHVAPGRRHYAPVDAEAIERYAMFKRMGFFGVERNHRRGAVQFLRVSQAILGRPRSALWVTPQGRFADVRQRPPGFERGLGALAARCEQTMFLPIALEYSFWEERLPEVLIRLGRPTLVEYGRALDDGKWTRLFEQSLRDAQDELSARVICRDADAFEVILRGSRGVSAVYDAWRAVKARLSAKPFRREHGNL